MTKKTPPHHDPSPDSETGDETVLTGSTVDVFTALTGKTDCTAADLARATGLGRSTATRALAYLEQHGLAVRTRGQLEGGRRTPDRWEPAPEQATQPHTTEHTETTPEPDPNPALAKEDTEQDKADAPLADTAQPVENTAAAATDGHNATHPTPDGTRPHADGAPATSPTPGRPTAAPESDTPPTPAPAAGRLAPGALREQVLRHLQTHPTEEFTATQISRVIERSSGAIANALATLTTKGLAERVTDTPRRYRLTDATETNGH
ncbi:MarR family transcriptional regulator [Streptomyces sp. WAC 06738]|uniref:MarR family transcriptional regulator n=1 Tax=Streptomyces sp. WAC 06738 TaxID=2203210 RepID=UPI0013E0682A|nr:MarR family transcriptional regulator [Streptomyces sp. WAC 06738]